MPKQFDIYGKHGLSYHKGVGRLSRYNRYLNDIIKRALFAAEIPSVLEPIGVYRRDGKH